MDIDLFLTKLAARLQLGNLTANTKRVLGGLLHTMYRLDTDKGIYIIKLLNPNVMKRGEALSNYAEAERLENILAKNDIPIIPALILNGRKMQKLDGHYLYVYEWHEGKPLKGRDITKEHCYKISKALSRIHQIDRKAEKYERNQILINWDAYLALAREEYPLVFGLLHANRELLYASQDHGNMAIPFVPALTAICHNDMDSKNVLWINNDFKIIDLECLGYSNPYLELFELALCWSGYEECSIDFELFRTFIGAYFEDKPKPDIDWKAIYACNYSRLEWLEYNVKRALKIECGSAQEQKLGADQVNETIKHILYYTEVKEKVLRCLSEIFRQ